MKHEADRVPFTEKDVKNYLDMAIQFWREKKDSDPDAGLRHVAVFYVDAYQCTRMSLFGELLEGGEGDKEKT